jgi:hypothetical protein
MPLPLHFGPGEFVREKPGGETALRQSLENNGAGPSNAEAAFDKFPC